MKKSVAKFRPQIRSRHPSHGALRKGGHALLSLMPFRSVVRFGSLTEFSDTVKKGGTRIELNTTDAIKVSSNKLLMKKAFTKAGVKTPLWWSYDPRTKMFINQVTGKNEMINTLPYPIVSKHVYGSRGRGNAKHDTRTDLEAMLKDIKNFENYIFEAFINFGREYRLHVCKDGCFYTCRKMLKEETADDKRWYRNDSNCSWFVETNPKFDKPNNWAEIVDHSVRALQAVGLDMGAVDVKVQTNAPHDFTIIEINSAPSFGEITAKKYQELIPKLLLEKQRA